MNVRRVKLAIDREYRNNNWTVPLLRFVRCCVDIIEELSTENLIQLNDRRAISTLLFEIKSLYKCRGHSQTIHKASKAALAVIEKHSLTKAREKRLIVGDHCLGRDNLAQIVLNFCKAWVGELNASTVPKFCRRLNKIIERSIEIVWLTKDEHRIVGKAQKLYNPKNRKTVPPISDVYEGVGICPKSFTLKRGRTREITILN